VRSNSTIGAHNIERAEVGCLVAKEAAELLDKIECGAGREAVGAAFFIFEGNDAKGYQ
jgi:hypothetical protein